MTDATPATTTYKVEFGKASIYDYCNKTSEGNHAVNVTYAGTKASAGTLYVSIYDERLNMANEWRFDQTSPDGKQTRATQWLDIDPTTVKAPKASDPDPDEPVLAAAKRACAYHMAHDGCDSIAAEDWQDFSAV